MPDLTSRIGQRAQTIDARFRHCSEFEGMDVFGNGGQPGIVEDLFISADTFDFGSLRMTKSKTLPKTRIIVPIEKLQHMADQEVHLVLM